MGRGVGVPRSHWKYKRQVLEQLQGSHGISNLFPIGPPVNFAGVAQDFVGIILNPISGHGIGGTA